MNARRVVFGSEGAELRAYPLRALRPGEILIKSRCSLISIGTETTLYLSSRWGQSEPVDAVGSEVDEWGFDDYGQGDTWDMARNRRFPGYAVAGDVVAVADGVEEFKPGDRVVALHHHADYAIVSTHPAITLRIPEGVTYEAATLCVLGSVSLHAIHRADIKLGEETVVMGAGLVGLLAVQLAKLSGAYPVISVDLSAERLAVASRVGADHVINPNEEDLVASVRRYLGGSGTRCTIEAVGNPAVLQACMQVSAPGGRIVVMGAIVGKVELDLYSEFVFRELTLIAAQQPRNPVEESIYYRFTGQRNRQTLLSLISRDSINVADLLTHRYKADDAPAVYELLGHAKAADYDAQGDVNRGMIGVVLEWS